MAWWKENFLNPYSRAMDNLSRDRVQLMSDFKALKKVLDVPKDLRKKNSTGFTNEQAVRVYLFEKTGKEAPGLSKTDKAELLDVVNKSEKVKRGCKLLFLRFFVLLDISRQLLIYCFYNCYDKKNPVKNNILKKGL